MCGHLARRRGRELLDLWLGLLLRHSRRRGVASRRQFVEVLELIIPAIFVGLVAPAVPKRKRCPVPLVVRVVNGVGGTDKTDALASVGGAPRLPVDAELVPRRVLNRSALVVYPLLCRGQLWEMLAGDTHCDCTVDLLLARVLPDALNFE